MLLQAKCKGGLYPLSNAWPPTANSRQAFSTNKVDPEVLHRRLGHHASSIVLEILQSNKLASVPNKSLPVCDAYQQSKIHQLPYSVSDRQSLEPLELVHSDVGGPAVASIGWFKYYVSFLDDFNRFTWIHLLKHKSDGERVFVQFQKHTKCLLGTKIPYVQSDWGGEY